MALGVCYICPAKGVRMKSFKVGNTTISEKGPCFVIAEIGHNHQGDLATAIKMIQTAAACGVQAVKFQKRDNKTLYTKAFYDRPYDNENSYGATYGEHREHLEFGRKEYIELIACAKANNVEFMCAPFDLPSVEFLEDLKIGSYKTASGDVTNVPFLRHIAKLKKPMFVSTGAATLADVRRAHDAVREYNDKLCLLHCTAGYPTEYHDLNLRVVETMKREFPDALIGYSGHDNGILAAVVACMLGAVVVEKHFTLNHAWKGTDHKFSLEPEGMRKQVRDLRRLSITLGDGIKNVQPFETFAKQKMGKGLYAARALKKGTVLAERDIAVKSPGNELEPWMLDRVVGRKLKKNLNEEDPLSLAHLA